MGFKQIFQALESKKNLVEFLPKLVLSLVFLLTISYIISPNEAFAQMESMTIEGPKHPFVNSIFNVYVDVEGVSRATYGIFRMVMTIYEKDSGEEMVAVPDYLFSGINTIQINMSSCASACSSGSRRVRATIRPGGCWTLAATQPRFAVDSPA